MASCCGTLALLASAAAAQCPVTTLMLGQLRTGALGTGDCTVAQFGIEPTDQSLLDAYWLRLTSTTKVTIDLRSSDFDAFLALLEFGSGRLLQFDDDGGGGLDARLAGIRLSAGDYRILANSFASGETGAYTLSATAGLLPQPPATPRISR